MTPRHLEMLRLTAEGYSDPEIGRTLFMSTGSVKLHQRLIRDQLRARNRTHAVVLAIQLGHLDLFEFEQQETA